MRRYVILLALTCAALPARADDCATIMNTLIAQTTTPYTAMVTMSGPNMPQQVTKSIFTGSKFFTQVDGQWHSMTMDPKQEQAMIQDAAKAAKETCHRQGNDSGGVLYVSHVVAPGSTSDNKIWIAGNRVLKTDVQIQGGPHIVTTYDYAHFAAPAGVN